MRHLSASAVLALSLFALGACDDEKPASTAPSATPAAAPTPSMEAAPAPAPASSAPKVAKGIQAPRPFPLGSSGPVQPSAPPEQQMMAIGYTIAMLAPQGTDPLVGQPKVEEIVNKLGGVVRGADRGKTPPNPVKATKGNRKIEIQMGKGCTDRIPSNLLVQRANIPMQTAYEAGILVVMCHDDKWECHQSTRDSDDVLCLAAPR